MALSVRCGRECEPGAAITQTLVMTIAGEDENNFPIFDEADPNKLLSLRSWGCTIVCGRY